MLSAKYIHVSKISQCMSCIINFYSTLYTRIQLLCCMSPMPWLSGKRISQMVLGSNPSWSLNLASFATSCIHIEMIQYVMCSIHRRIWHCVQGTSDTMARTPQTCGCEDLERYNTLYLLSDSSLCMWNYIQVSQRQAWCRPVSPPHFTESMILCSPDLTLLCLCLGCSTYIWVTVRVTEQNPQCPTLGNVALANSWYAIV